MKKLVLAIAISTVAFGASASKVTQISDTNIRKQIDTYQFDLDRDNNALVEINDGNYHDVVITQGEAVKGLDLNRAVVSYQGSGSNNDTAISQDRFSNDALVKASSEAKNNDVSIDQTDNNRALVSLAKADGNVVDIEQNYNNQARVSIAGNNKNWAYGNDIDIDQTGNSNIANVNFIGNVDDYDVLISQGGNGSRAEVELKNSSDSGYNNLIADADNGIHIVQTHNDYAGVFVSNSDNTAVYINQQ